MDINRAPGNVLERIFGRILPNDLLSLALAYLTVPSGATMPGFWLEGAAIWAETAYGDADSPWLGGRGRSSMQHMIWRLDAAAGQLPQLPDWQDDWHVWPYGGRIYDYGAAYARYLAARFPDKDLWSWARDQAEQWRFLFSALVLIRRQPVDTPN